MSAQPQTSFVTTDMIADDGRAVYASRPAESRGRIHDEPPSKTRGAFERDRDRIIHSKAFRRLKFKTQVFAYHEGDHYRTRLSHSIEVAQVARSLARLLKVNEDLAETCSLAHDLGHTPFAHVGEDALKECMESYGGFDHNDQTLRVVTKLEKKYLDFDGLNLSWESLEGLIKHNGPVTVQDYEVTLNELKEKKDFMLDTHASVEAQIAGIADDIAYNSHDLDDGLGSGLLSIDDLAQVTWVQDIVDRKRKEFPGIDRYLLGQEIIRDVMGAYVMDVLQQTQKNLMSKAPQNADDVRRAGIQIVSMSEEMKKKDRSLRDFLWANFYRHHEVSRVRVQTFKIVQDLFNGFMEHPRCLKPKQRQQLESVPDGWNDDNWKARTVADYIASMTDRMAVLEHQELYDVARVIE